MSIPDLVLSTRMLDDLGRTWAQTPNGSWGAIGYDATADTLADAVSRYGMREVTS